MIEKPKETPQEPAWLRSYKTRAAPFSSTGPKSSDSTTLAYTPSEKQDEKLGIDGSRADIDDEQSQYKPLSVAFPSTLSLGLSSFGRYVPPNLDIHPALRDAYRRDEGLKMNGSTDDKRSKIDNATRGPRSKKVADTSSGATKPETRHKRRALKHMKKKDEPMWKKIVRGCVRRLGCGGDGSRR